MEHTMRRSLLVFSLLSALLLSGCSGLLPHSESITSSRWQDFDEVKAAYNKVEVQYSGEVDLQELGFTPDRSPNVHILTHLEIVNRVMPNQALSREDMPPGLLKCLSLQDGCHAYEIKLMVTRNKRYGSFVADFLNFHRQTHIQGWTFNAVFVLQNNLVVYKVWNGTPRIDEHKETSNPLGPLQDLGGDVIEGPSVEF
jgi:hypothetical protein